MNELKEQHIATIKDAAQKLTGAKRRAFQAHVALDYLNGSARRAEAVCGWSRRTVILGLHELRTGLTCVDNTAARGNRPTEEKRPQLAEDMRSLVEPHSQVDPKFQSPFCHIPPNYVVKPASFTIPLLFQDIPPMVCHELSRPHNLGVTHGTRSQTNTRKPHHYRRFSG